MAQYARCTAIDVVDTFIGSEDLGLFAKRKASKERKRYTDEINGLLDKIYSTVIGKRLFASLARHGKPVVISMPDYSQVVSHRKKCSSSATAKALSDDVYRVPNLAQNSIAAHAEIVKAVAAGGQSCEAIATFMNHALATTRASDLRVKAADLKELLESDPSKMAPGVERNRKFGPLIDYPFGYYLKAAVEAHLPHGPGAKTTVRFDPWNTLGGSRGPDIGLFHELVHAWHNVSGRKMFTDDHEENERMTIGLEPFWTRHTGNRRLYTENAYRSELGLPARTSID